MNAKPVRKKPNATPLGKFYYTKIKQKKIILADERDQFFPS